MKATERYQDLDPKKRYLEYALEILHKCLVPSGYTEARNMLNELKADAAENYPERIGEITKAENCFEIIDKHKEKANIVIPDAGSEEFFDQYRKFRDILLRDI